MFKRIPLWLFSAVLLLALAAGAGAQSVTTNKDDYVPGETVYITGTGFHANETVSLRILSSDGVVDVQGESGTDENGTFTASWLVTDAWLNRMFLLTADCEHPGPDPAHLFASTTFTDSVTSVTITSPTNASPVTVTSLPANLTISFNYITSPTGTTTGTADILGTSLTASKTLTSGTGSDSITVTIPAGTANGQYNVKVTVDNSTGTGSNQKNDNQNSAVIINVLNRPPVLGSIGNKSIDEEAPLTFTATASDPDPSNTLTFSLVGAPAGASITNGGAFTWTPTEAQGPGNYTFKVVVSDGSLTDEEEITVTVNEVNQAPVLAAIGDKTVDELQALTVTVSASDADIPANTLSYTLTTKPEGMTIDSGTGVISWTPTEAQGPGDYSVIVGVSDGKGGSDSKSFSVHVNEVNQAPVLTPIGSQTVDEGSLLSFTATASDPDVPANTLTFSLQGAPAGASITSGGVFTWTPTEEQGPGSYTFTVKVTDDGSLALSDEEEITVTVNEVNKAPVLAAIGGKTVNEGSLLTFTASATDPDLPVNTLFFSLEGAPAGASIDAGTGAFSFTPSDGPATYTFTVKVTDNGTPAFSDEEEITITVHNVDPSVSAGSDETLNEGDTLVRTGSFTDPGADTWTATVDYGDGSGSQSLALNPGKTFSLNHTYADNDTYTVTVTVTDKDNGVGTAIFQVTVNNVVPTVDAGKDATINEGSVFASSGSFVDPGADTWAAKVDYGDGSGEQPLTLNPDKTFALSHTYADNGSYTVTITITDDDGGLGSDTATVTVNNVAPAVTPPADQAAHEGTAASISLGSFADPGPDNPWTVDVDWGDGSAPATFDASSAGSLGGQSHTYADNGTYTVTVTVTDKDNASGTATFQVIVSNVAPTVTITSPPSGTLVTVNTGIALKGSFTDPGALDTHIADWVFTSATDQQAVTLNLNAGVMTADTTIAFATPGVYYATLTVTDKDGDAGMADTVAGLPAFVVVYDPNGSFVTGGGWINSPAGAYRDPANPTFDPVGKATFGFVSKYQKGIPTGNTEFQFKAGDLNFKSMSYDWLVVAGARAQFKGSGTINGRGNYGFLLTAIDGQVSGGGGYDRFRIKIVDKFSGVTVYDNQRGADDNDPLSVQTILGGGSIVIHK